MCWSHRAVISPKNMVNHILKIGGLGLLVLMGGCVPDEDTSPSAALFPTTHFGEVRPDFTNQLTNRATRNDVELYALFGVSYVDYDQKSLRPVEDALVQGFYSNPKNGKKIYRVQSIGQARELLQNMWSEEEWEMDSDLANQFKLTPNASIALIGAKDQRILFFDQGNQLAQVYPKAG